MGKQIASFDLGPGGVSMKDISKVIDAADPDSSLLVQADGVPGEVLSNIWATSSSSSSSLSVPLPWKDRKQTANGGQHPWRIDEAYSSTVMLSNPDLDLPHSVQLSIYANDAIWTKKVAIPPLSTVPISINDIVTKEEPDDKGRKLAKNASQGLVTWSGFAQPITFGMLVQRDPFRGLVRPYACAEYYQECNATIPDLNLAVNGATGSVSATVWTCGTWGDCSCVESCNPNGSEPGLWSSGDPTESRII